MKWSNADMESWPAKMIRRNLCVGGIDNDLSKGTARALNASFLEAISGNAQPNLFDLHHDGKRQKGRAICGAAFLFFI